MNFNNLLKMALLSQTDWSKGLDNLANILIDFNKQKCNNTWSNSPFGISPYSLRNSWMVP